MLSVSDNGTALLLLLNAQTGSADYLTMPSASRLAAISPLAQVREGNDRTPTFVIHSRQGVVGDLLGLESVPHLHDLYTQSGTREWEEQVAPGYRFLQDAIMGLSKEHRQEQ